MRTFTLTSKISEFPALISGYINTPTPSGTSGLHAGLLPRVCRKWSVFSRSLSRVRAMCNPPLRASDRAPPGGARHGLNASTPLNTPPTTPPTMPPFTPPSTMILPLSVPSSPSLPHLPPSARAGPASRTSPSLPGPTASSVCRVPPILCPTSSPRHSRRPPPITRPSPSSPTRLPRRSR